MQLIVPYLARCNHESALSENLSQLNTQCSKWHLGGVALSRKFLSFISNLLAGLLLDARERNEKIKESKKKRGDHDKVPRNCFNAPSLAVIKLFVSMLAMSASLLCLTPLA